MWFNGNEGSWLLFFPLIINTSIIIVLIILAVCFLKRFIETTVNKQLSETLKESLEQEDTTCYHHKKEAADL